jgi:hypothetical protein
LASTNGRPSWNALPGVTSVCFGRWLNCVMVFSLLS